MFQRALHPHDLNELYTKWTVAGAVFFVALEACYWYLSGAPSFSKPSVDFNTYAVGRDFINTWMGGRSAFEGGPAAWFDMANYNAALREMLGSFFPDHYWSYPPHILLFIWPFGLLPYFPAYLLWCVLGVALYLLASTQLVRRNYLLFLAVAPGVAVCAFFGQNGFYTSALFLGGMMLLDRRPLLAGILFGILTVKPQIGYLLPIVLLLTGRWRTIAAACATAAALIAATTIWFGADIWVEYFEKVLPQQKWLITDGRGLLLTMVSSVFFASRRIELPQYIGWALQIVVSLSVIAAVIWTYWRKRDPLLSLAFLATATFLASPYILNYDMVMLGCMVAALRDREDTTDFDHWLGLAVWSLPASMMLFGALFIPIAPVVLIVFAGRLLQRLRQSERRQPSQPSELVQILGSLICSRRAAGKAMAGQ